MKNPANTFAAWLESLFQHKPVHWTFPTYIDDSGVRQRYKAPTPMQLTEKVPGLRNYPLITQFNLLTTKQQRKKLNVAMNLAKKNLNATAYPPIWLDKYNLCLLRALVVLQTCWNMGIPARLGAFDVETTKFSGRTRDEPHMVVECNLMILDLLNVDVRSNYDYMGKVRSLCDHTDPNKWIWYKARLDI